MPLHTISETVEKGCTRAVHLPNIPPSHLETRVYGRRIWMLFVFSSTSMLSAMTFPQHTSLANVTSCFYGVSQQAVEWTANLILVVYVVSVLPMASLVNRLDLRRTVICASFFSTAAAATQFLTLTPGSFYFVMGSSFLSAIATAFVLGVPPILAAKWFPPCELSRACAFGIFGNQIGIAIGFILPPLMLSSKCSETELITAGKMNLATLQTALNIIFFVLIIFTFQNAPKYPPSAAQSQKRSGPADEPYSKVLLKLCTNVNFVLIFIVFGFMMGSYYAVCSTLNKLMIYFHPNKEMEIGWMGTLFVLSGQIGSMIGGYILDKTGKFKETSVGICVTSLISFMLFSCVLPLPQMWIQIVCIGIFGFFLTSYVPIGLEYALEVTYPLSESVIACLLNAAAALFGIILTEIVSHILEDGSPIYSNLVLATTILICCVISSFISKDYKRSTENAKPKIAS